MKKNKIVKLLLLATANFILIGCGCDNWPDEKQTKPVAAIGIIKYRPHEYKNACFMAYRWDRDGNTWVLLGEEIRGRMMRRVKPDVKLRPKWFDFCGGRKPEDENSWQTALREASEETAGQLKLSRGIIFTYRGEQNTIHYIAPVEYISSSCIELAAQKLRNERRGKGIEKIKWQWVKLEDLICGTTGLDLYWGIKRKLHNKAIIPFLELLNQSFK